MDIITRVAKLRESNNLFQVVKVELIKSTMLQVFLNMLTKHLPPNEPTVHTEKAKLDFMKFVEMEGIEFDPQIVELTVDARRKQIKATVSLLLSQLQTMQIQIMGMERITSTSGQYAIDAIISHNFDIRNVSTEVAILTYQDLVDQLLFIKQANPIKLMQNVISDEIDKTEVATLLEKANTFKSIFNKTTMFNNGYESNDIVVSLLNGDNYQGIVNYLNSFIKISQTDIELFTEAVEKTIEQAADANGHEFLTPFTQSIEIVATCSCLMIDVLFTRMLLADTILNKR
jgi:hypothetical protein